MEESVSGPKNDSLVEVLIVIAIILIIAATAVPNLLRAARADQKSLATGARLVRTR